LVLIIFNVSGLIASRTNAFENATFWFVVYFVEKSRTGGVGVVGLIFVGGGGVTTESVLEQA
jgi:hypothetical protein